MKVALEAVALSEDFLPIVRTEYLSEYVVGKQDLPNYLENRFNSNSPDPLFFETSGWI